MRRRRCVPGTAIEVDFSPIVAAIVLVQLVLPLRYQPLGMSTAVLLPVPSVFFFASAFYQPLGMSTAVLLPVPSVFFFASAFSPPPSHCYNCTVFSLHFPLSQPL